MAKVACAGRASTYLPARGDPPDPGSERPPCVFFFVASYIEQHLEKLLCNAVWLAGTRAVIMIQWYALRFERLVQYTVGPRGPPTRATRLFGASAMKGGRAGERVYAWGTC